jgi:hypothetical protein
LGSFNRKFGKICFILDIRRRPQRKHFEKYIGVGYKDKGAAKVEHNDGSPSWQTITAEGEAKFNEIVAANSRKVAQSKSEKRISTLSLEVSSLNSYKGNKRVLLVEYSIDNLKVFLEDIFSDVCPHSEMAKESIISKFKCYIPINYKGKKGFVVNECSPSRNISYL